MAIIEIGIKQTMVDYAIVVHQANMNAPTRIVVPTQDNYRELFHSLHEAGMGTEGVVHTLIPNEYPTFHYVHTSFMGLITQAMPLILYEPKSKLLLDVDNSEMISEAFTKLASK